MARKRVLGTQSLRRKIKRMPDDIKAGVQDAIKDSADVVYSDALSRAPVDEGDLAAALHRKLSGDKLAARIGYWRKGNIRRWKRAGWRAHFTEFGTKDQPAQPFLGPAFRKNKTWIINRIERAVDLALKRAANV